MIKKQKNKPFIIAGNWKMNPTTKQDARALFAVYKNLAIKHTNINFVTAVPTVFLSLLGKISTPANLILSAENVFYTDSGSYTGSVSVPMVIDCGARMTLIGHSERRNLFGISNEIIRLKIEHCLSHDMPMIVCFGDTQRDEAGEYITELENQLEAILEPFISSKKLSLLHLAYEPVWAIGESASRCITPDELFSTLLLVIKIVAKYIGETRAKKIPLLYGGSVNDFTAQELSRVPLVSGFLIGRASLDAKQLKNIISSIT